MDDQLNPTTTNFTLRFRINGEGGIASRTFFALAKELLGQRGTIATDYGERPVQFVSMDTKRPDDRMIEVAIHIEMS